MTPVGNTGQPVPNGLSNLSSILDIQNKRIGLQQAQQNLQTGQYTQQSAQAGAQQDQMKAAQAQAVSNLTKNASAYQKADGSGFDSQRFSDDVNRVAPLLPEIANAATSKAGMVYDNQQKLLSMSSDRRQKVGDTFAALAADPTADHAKYVKSLQDLVKQYPNDPAMSDVVISSIGSMPNQEGTPLQQWGRNVAIAAKSAGAEQTNPAISTMQGQQGLQPVQTNPQAVGGIAPVGKALPQGVTPGMTALPQGNIGVVGPSGTVRQATDISAPQAPSTSKLPPLQRPGINAQGADIANYNARIDQAGKEYQAVSGAANDPQNGVQVSRYRNGQILDLTKVAPTGPGKDIWNHVASQIPGEGADAFQKIGHYLAQNSAAMAGKMGVPNTNMGQETAAAAAGNTAQNPKAIAEITRVNDALNTGFDIYNRGLAKVTNNGSDLSRAASYKQAFGSNLDVNALRWADAHRRGDTEEINQLRQKFGDKGIAGWTQKLNNLKSLATVGDLP
jgi:hypothetical protein